MASLVVWAVFVAVSLLLGLTAHNFSLRTTRWVSAITVVVLVCLITKYGINLWFQQHPQSQSANLNLVNAFTGGVDASIQDLLRPLLFGYHGSPPGPIGRGVAACLLVVGYRGLEAWAMRRQVPQLDSTVLIGGQPSVPSDGAEAGADGGDPSTLTDAQLHDLLAAELRFRLAALEVRAPAILPGGSKTSGLASIAEASGSNVGGLAGAIIRFAGSIWPNPRQLQLRVWVEPRTRQAESKAETPPPESSGTQVTVYLENPRNGATVASKTLACADINEAASMVAGYVGRQVFSRDPSTPPWCYGRVDGRDLGALLQNQLERVPAKTFQALEESRRSQVDIMWRWASTRRSAGLVKYELASLLDLDGDHLAALRLHALNREQYPRFYRGRYRLGMSLEMIASPECVIRYDGDTKSQLDEILGILNRQHLTTAANCGDDDLKPCVEHENRCALSPSLRLNLLIAAARVLGDVRMQLTLRRVVWNTVRHRNERAIWLPYWTWLPGWGLRRRWAFQDSVCVAELLVALRIALIRAEIDGKSEYEKLREALQETSYEKDPRRYEHAIRIASDIGQQGDIIKGVLNQGMRRTPGRVGPWLLLRSRKTSWQAAYNAACLYAALARLNKANKELELQTLEAVVRCLRSAIDDRRTEMERPFDWISRDPDLFCLCGQGEGSLFQKFLNDQQRLDYPGERSSGSGMPLAEDRERHAALHGVADESVTSDALGV
jgi:hypothetical protein